MNNYSFDDLFPKITRHHPFPWQQDLYRRINLGLVPELISIPTSLGKTEAVLISWFIAKLNNPNGIPTRLVYIVNNRTVVDQATNTAKKIMKFSQVHNLMDLAISTLRGQYADNEEWYRNPNRPAIILGTVDMIGSRLLHQGYRASIKTRPIHAALLGKDSICFLDEAQLEPAFLSLLRKLKEVQNQYSVQVDKNTTIVEMTATSRSIGKDTLSLSLDDLNNPLVQKRYHASKNLFLIEVDKEKEVNPKIRELALYKKNSSVPIAVYVNSKSDAIDINRFLKQKKCNTVLLIGPMRGHERSNLLESPSFKRFTPEADSNSTQGTVYLIATSAGEVGANTSAAHAICDLVTFEREVQRVGRVNRFGEFSNSSVTIVYSREMTNDKSQSKENEASEA